MDFMDDTWTRLVHDLIEAEDRVLVSMTARWPCRRST